MDKQKKNAGITLIALVISIIVMLILAGVSINATVGDNGILKKAMEASNKQKLAQETENLNLELAKLNIDTITNNEADTIQNIVDYLIKQGVIDEAVKTSSGAIAVGVDRETGSKYFFGKKGEHIYKISRGKDDILVAELSQSVSGGQIEGGSSLVTADSFDNDSSLPPEEKGKFNITSDANVAFMDTISGELCFYIKSGVHASIEIYADMTLTNEGIKRSAIDIEPGGTLDLYVGEGVTLTVDSGYGIVAPPATGDGFTEEVGIPGGSGAYAGIRVPWIDENSNDIREEKEYAILNLYGKGVLYAYGGDAGDGGDGGYNNLDWGGAGRTDGAGAGIGGNGGNGGSTIFFLEGNTGEQGESCGEININDTLKIYAFGGAGGTGGRVSEGGSVQSGGGGSGFPAAGIGGGGAGGTSGNTQSSGGGFGCGCGEYIFEIGGKNGCTLDTEQKLGMGIGGSYYESFACFDFTTYNDYNKFNENQIKSLELSKTLWNYIRNDSSTGISGGIGGGGTDSRRNDLDFFYIPDSAQAGKGGIINVKDTSKVYAYNGSYITTKDSKLMSNDERINYQALIYAQVGFNVKKIRELFEVKKVKSRTAEDLVKEWEIYNNSINRDIDYSALTNYSTYENGSKVSLGIGSGAGGFQEKDGNGQFNIIK